MTEKPFPSKLLSAVTEKIQDGTHFSPKTGGRDFKYITSKNIGFGTLRLDAVETISAGEHEKIYRRADTRFGDILLTKDGANTGNAALNTFDDEVSLLSSVAFIRADSSVINESFLLQYLLSTPGQKQITDAMAGNAITRLTLAKIKNLSVPLPSIREQQAISRILTDVDDLISALQRLVAKKRDIKQGLMQELVTGKTRLPGFTGDWREQTLGQIAHIRTGGRNNQDKVEGGRYPFFVRSATIERIDSYSYDCEAILVPGEGGIGSIYHYIDGKFEVHQRVYNISEFSGETSGKFVYQYMRQFFRSHALGNTVKATVDSLRLPTFQNFVLTLPPSRAEQDSIAQVLQDADDELAALERSLNSARAIKQGMMQELLTGRTRLIQEVPV